MAVSNGPVTWLGQGPPSTNNGGSNSKGHANKRRRPINARSSFFSASSILPKLSLAMVIWSIANIILTALLVENLSESDRNSLKEEVGKEVNLIKRILGTDHDGEEAEKRQPKVNSHHALRAATDVHQSTKDSVPKPSATAADAQQSSEKSALKPPARRFPQYGTHEFSARCPWIFLPPPLLEQNRHADNCLFLVRPAPKDNEGLAAWVAKIPTEYMMAKQTGCKLKISYGPGVKIGGIWEIQPGATLTGADTNPFDWYLSEAGALGDCSFKDQCFNTAPKSEKHVAGVASRLGVAKKLALAPMYRYAAHGPKAGHQLYREDYAALEKALPGLTLEDAAACAFGSTVKLSEKAVQYEPDLFTKLLPALYHERSLVISVYMRTLNSDKMADQAEKGVTVDESGKLAAVRPPNGVIECVQKIEQQYLNGEKKLGDGVDIDSVVWFVVTDSKALKEKMATEYGDKDIGHDSSNKKVSRRVISTNTRGIHTRRKRQPTTADFAEALIDWHLMGESDLIVGSPGFSFQSSAAVRASTPYYDHDTCEAIPLLYDRKANATDNDVSAASVNNNVAKESIKTGKALAPEPKYKASNRFPQEGSKEFKRVCRWTETYPKTPGQCTILVRPREQEHEGLGMWVATISVGYMVARQNNCKFRLAYRNVDIGHMFRPKPFLPEDHIDNWKVPADYQCEAKQQCYEISSSGGPGFGKIASAPESVFSFAEVPVYRHALTTSTNALYREMFNPLKEVMPDLSLETAFACSMSKLLHISPHYRKYSRNLYSEILPKLQDEKSLVITLYYRTGHAEESGESTAKDLVGMESDLEKSIHCTEVVETGFVEGTHPLDRAFTSIVWNVISDSPYTRKEIASRVDGKEVKSSNGKTYNRSVVYTNSEGAHTKTQSSPTEQAFAESFLDWFLIGESDAVISHKGWSYGMTGALRTARPIFKPWKDCKHPAILINEGDGKTELAEARKGLKKGNIGNIQKGQIKNIVVK